MSFGYKRYGSILFFRVYRTLESTSTSGIDLQVKKNVKQQWERSSVTFLIIERIVNELSLRQGGEYFKKFQCVTGISKISHIELYLGYNSHIWHNAKFSCPDEQTNDYIINFWPTAPANRIEITSHSFVISERKHFFHWFFRNWVSSFMKPQMAYSKHFASKIFNIKTWICKRVFDV